MAYQNNIPQPTDRLKDSQGDLLGDFLSIPILIDVDHYSFGHADEGRHKKVTLPTPVPAAPAPPFAATQNGLYSLLNATTAKNEVYIHGQKNGATTSDIPFTASSLSTTVPAQGQAGWTYLPSGILLRWGTTVLLPANSVYPVDLVGLTPAFTNIFTVMVTTSSPGNSSFAKLNAITSNTEFAVYSYNPIPGNRVYATYLVIGN